MTFLIVTMLSNRLGITVSYLVLSVISVVVLQEAFEKFKKIPSEIISAITGVIPRNNNINADNIADARNAELPPQQPAAQVVNQN